MTKKRLRLFHKCWLTGLAIFLFLTSSNIIVSAVSLDLFSNTQVSNNSGTTSATPYLNVANKPVAFTISGTTAIGATAGRTGAKYAFVNVPAQLAGKVQKDGNATVDTTVTVLASDIKAVTGTVLDLVTSLTGLLTTLGLGTLVTNLNSAVTALNKEDFGRQVFLFPVEQYSSTLLRADISQGLLPIITNALILRLQAIQAIVQGITPLPLINVVLNNLLTALTNTISTLGNANSTVSKNLAAASILGSTSVSFPTLVSSPTGLTQDFTTVVRGGIFQTDNFDVQLLSNYGGNTNLYFAAGSLTMKNELLPSSLNFGSHPVQTKVDETWNAYIGGSSANPLQTGTIRIDDTRTTAKA
ncbi:adhesive domain-containing protein [Enterococcus avium]